MLHRRASFCSQGGGGSIQGQGGSPIFHRKWETPNTGTRSIRGRYVSYWNAFYFQECQTFRHNVVNQNFRHLSNRAILFGSLFYQDFAHIKRYPSVFTDQLTYNNSIRISCLRCIILVQIYLPDYCKTETDNSLVMQLIECYFT